LRVSIKPVIVAAALAAVAACTSTSASEPAMVAPVAKWDQQADAPLWTEASLNALRSHGAALVSITPADAEAWCPGYDTATLAEREAFWVGLLSALAEHESTWNPRAVGGGGQWFGLVQISPATARGYGCEAGSADALKDGTKNLSCAIRIWANTVSRDGVIAAGGRGVAADWGPFHQSSKREAMNAWTRAQPYCQQRGA
jgi:hypothetical protein